MAKKTSKPATKAKKTPAKSSKAREIKVDAVEAEAIELVHTSDRVCGELEEAVTTAACQAVRKVFKQHGISLNPEQTQKVAFLLFRD